MRLSADGVPVVFHDGDLSRIGGSKKEVASLSASELQRLTGAPTLREVLLGENVPKLINIEIKSGSVRDDSLEKSVVAAVLNARAENRVLFSSFNPFSLRRLSRLAPQIPRAILVTERAQPGNRIWFRRMWFAAYARPHFLHADDQMVTPARMRRWSERGIPVSVWTVNDVSRSRELMAMGVKSVISDQLFK